MSKSKIEKDINQIIINDEQVPDSVLDNARMAMQQDTYSVKRRYRLRSLRISLVSVLLILGILLPIVVIQICENNHIFQGQFDSYEYQNLQKVEIESIGAYNKKYNFDFSFLDLPIKSSYYLTSDDKKCEALEEHYDYDGREIILHIEVTPDYQVTEFDNLTFHNMHKYNDQIVFYKYEDNTKYLYFSISNTNYFIYYDGESIEIDKILEKLC